MSAINSDTIDAWKQLARDLEPDRPSTGKRVEIINSKKYQGQSGIVSWHGINRFADCWKYSNDAQSHLRDLEGKRGYRVKVVTDSGESFFIDADKVRVITNV